MTLQIIIISCSLLLLGFVFELLAKKIKAPSVILMLLLGWLTQQLTTAMNVQVPSLDLLLPVFGTVGLILIVLEGAMELELTKEKTSVIKKSFFIALLPILTLAFLVAYAFYQNGQGSFKDCLSNAIPLCIISSAIAIPSASGLGKTQKEFVIFESSLSDILGVLFFNFVALNKELDIHSVEHFLLQIAVILVVTVVSTVGISFLITRIRYHVKYIPILLIVILVYAVSKTVHLPGLVFVLICGVLLGNISRFKYNKWISKLKPDEIADNIRQFKKITVEITFVIRVMFFVLFGFLIKTAEVINTDTIVWSLGIAAAIYIIRATFLLVSKTPIFPFVFIAPRGLITILLFFLIVPESSISLVNKSLITQVILITSVVMMLGLMFTKKEQEPVTEE